MSTEFDVNKIEGHGWRQGAVLGPNLTMEARGHAPGGIDVAESDWLIVTSHHCDVVNPKLEKEPTVELLRATVAQKGKPDRQQAWGRNPREIQLEVELSGSQSVVLSMRVHDRWSIPRALLMTEGPRYVLPDKSPRIIAEWLAKRYIRAAFPTAFDKRWRHKMKDWTSILENEHQWMQGVYLRVSPNTELDDDRPYKVALIIAPPATATKDPMWPRKRVDLESRVEQFWDQFRPRIDCKVVRVIPTSKLTLAEIDKYQRFDADWVSFADDSPATPPAADMRT